MHRQPRSLIPSDFGAAMCLRNKNRMFDVVERVPPLPQFITLGETAIRALLPQSTPTLMMAYMLLKHLPNPGILITRVHQNSGQRILEMPSAAVEHHPDHNLTTCGWVVMHDRFVGTLTRVLSLRVALWLCFPPHTPQLTKIYVILTKPKIRLAGIAPINPRSVEMIQVRR
jgi:hypothetical protein